MLYLEGLIIDGGDIEPAESGETGLHQDPKELDGGETERLQEITGLRLPP